MFNFDKTNLGRSVEKFESIVGATLKVEGDLVISKSLRIDGTVHGNILQAEGASATVAIASGASVLGNIAVHDVIVSGHLRGNITSPGRVELIDTAKVEGDVTTCKPRGSIGLDEANTIHLVERHDLAVIRLPPGHLDAAASATAPARLVRVSISAHGYGPDHGCLTEAR
jgi:cytoskeletal protein CcmA (bactofilin family)